MRVTRDIVARHVAFALLAPALGLGVGASLGACAQQPQAQDSSPRVGEGFVGAWEVVSSTIGGTQTNEAFFDLARESGYYTIYLDVRDDGTLKLDIWGEDVSEGTWEAQSASEATFAFAQGSETWTDPMALDGDRLTFGSGDLVIVFRRMETDNRSELTERVNAQVGALTPRAADEPADEGEALDATLVDNEDLTVRLVSRGSYAGDPAFRVSVTNNSDQRLAIAADDGWLVDGEPMAAVLVTVVDPGETTDGELWFYREEPGDVDEAALAEVSGAIVVSEEDSGGQATYEVSYVAGGEAAGGDEAAEGE